MHPNRARRTDGSGGDLPARVLSATGLPGRLSEPVLRDLQHRRPERAAKQRRLLPLLHNKHPARGSRHRLQVLALQLGLDLLDTITANPNAVNEVGNVTCDRIEVRVHPAVPD